MTDKHIFIAIVRLTYTFLSTLIAKKIIFIDKNFFVNLIFILYKIQYIMLIQLYIYKKLNIKLN